MGSPEYCYKKIMIEYILINVKITKYESIYTEEYLKTLSTEELEDLVKHFNRTYKAYGAYVGGIAVATSCNKLDTCNDMYNASAGAVSDFMNLLGIYDPENIDFEEP